MSYEIDESKPVHVIARELIGKVVVKGNTKLLIVETEAYGDEFDAASHNHESMGKAAGHIYIVNDGYLSLNITTGKRGKAEAVLIRDAKVLDDNYEAAGSLIGSMTKIVEKLELQEADGKTLEECGIELCSLNRAGKANANFRKNITESGKKQDRKLERKWNFKLKHLFVIIFSIVISFSMSSCGQADFNGAMGTVKKYANKNKEYIAVSVGNDNSYLSIDCVASPEYESGIRETPNFLGNAAGSATLELMEQYGQDTSEYYDYDTYDNQGEIDSFIKAQAPILSKVIRTINKSLELPEKTSRKTIDAWIDGIVDGTEGEVIKENGIRITVTNGKDGSCSIIYEDE